MRIEGGFAFCLGMMYILKEVVVVYNMGASSIGSYFIQ